MKKVTITAIVLTGLVSIGISSGAYACKGGNHDKGQNSEGRNSQGKHKKINHGLIASQLNLDQETQTALIDIMNKHRSERKLKMQKNHEQSKGKHAQHKADIIALLGEKKFKEFRSIMHEKRGRKCKGKS